MKHMGQDERNRIEFMLGCGGSVADMAKALGRSESTISRELLNRRIDSDKHYGCSNRLCARYDECARTVFNGRTAGTVRRRGNRWQPGALRQVRKEHGLRMDRGRPLRREEARPAFRGNAQEAAQEAGDEDQRALPRRAHLRRPARMAQGQSRRRPHRGGHGNRLRERQGPLHLHGAQQAPARVPEGR